MAEDYPFSTPDNDERVLSILSHILTIVPGVGILAPLIIYLIRKPEQTFLDANAKESLNWQISVWLAYIIAIILCFVLVGIPLLILIGVLNLVFVILASIKASENRIYRYPFNLRLIR